MRTGVGMRFSERQGLVSARSILQSESMDTALRSGLWDAVHIFILEKEPEQWRTVESSSFQMLFLRLWHNFFKTPLDSMPKGVRQAGGEIRKFFFSSHWYQVYDILEFIAVDLLESDESLGASFVEFINRVLERELSAYRLIEGQFAPISAEAEVSSIEDALANTSALAGAHAHLKSAISLLANRDSPDYRNSVKESISAVESIAKLLTSQPKATLGEALQKLESGGLIHPALKRSLSALYGYTSDAQGIRHAMLDEPKLGLTDAKFMLVSCTGFINYLVAKAAEGGISIKA